MHIDRWKSSAERARLLARIRARFDVVMTTHDLAGRQFDFIRVRDPDAVLDQVVAAEDDRERRTGVRHPNDELHLPYWAELWDSAIGIGHHLAAAEPVHGQTAMDLGCGMGFAGMVAAAMGYDVLAADLEPDALLFAKFNIGCATRKLNWQTDSLGQRFNLIIGADVLYDKTQWEYLEPFWRKHLAAGGSVLLGEPGRQTGEMFLKWIEGKGWFLRRQARKVATRETPIRLIRMSRG